MASRTLASPSDQETRPSDPTRGGKAMPLPNKRPSSISPFLKPQLFDLNFGSGKQKMKSGIHLKMKSNRSTMTIKRMSAHIVMIGIESVHIIPSSTPPPVLQGPIFPTFEERSLWNGHGSTESTRSPKLIPRMR